VANETLTEQQKKWMASVRSSLETSTGKTLDQWVEIARGNPETAPRARQKWLKDQHGLGQNYAMLVLTTLAEAQGEKPRDVDAFRAALWKDPAALAVLQAVEQVVGGFPGLVTGQRKGFTAYSNKFQFAALRPAKGAVRLGLAVPPQADPRLAPADREGWSERCTATLVLSHAAQVDAPVAALLRQAFDAS
jgi:hypothetical protein